MTDVRKALRKAPECGRGEAGCRAEMKGNAVKQSAERK